MEKLILYMELWSRLSRSKYFALSIYITLNSIFSFLPLFIVQNNSHTLISNSFNGFEFQSIKEFTLTWHKANGGDYTTLFLPHLLFVLMFYKLLSGWLASNVTIGIVKFVAGLTIYLLLGRFTKNPFVRIIGSLVYLLSIYGQAITENSLPGGYLFYALLPLYFYLFQTISKQNFAKFIFLYCVSLVFVVDTNFTYIAYLYLLFFLYSIYIWIVNKHYSRIKFFFFFLGIFILLSQVYYLPLIAYNYIYKAHLISTNLSAESAAWKSTDSSFSEVLRLMGSLDFYNAETIQNKVVYSHPFYQIFITNPVYILFSYVLSFTAFLGLIIESYITQKKKKIYEGVFYLIVLLIFFFFSVGIHPTNPFYFIYATLAEKISLFAIFRDPYKSVSILNLLYTIGLVYFFNYLRRLKKLYLIFIVFFSIVLLVFSQSYLRGGLFSKSEMVHIPQYVYDFAHWNQSTQRIHNAKKLLLPSEPFPVLSLAAFPGKGSPVYLQILDSKAVQNSVTFTPYIYDIQQTLYTPQFQRIIGFYNIPYVVNLYDNYAPLYKSTDPRKTAFLLQNAMQRQTSFGNGRIQVFKVSSSEVNAPVYIPQRVVTVNTFDPKKINLPAIFAQQKDNNFAFVDQKSINVSQKTPTLTITSQSNVKYGLNIKNISDKFLLVFNENFSPSWVLKEPGSLFKTLPIKHIEVNGFTNGFLLDRQTLLKTVDKKYIITNPDGSINVRLELYFQPQLYFYIGLGITAFTLLVSLGYFLYSSIRKR